MVITCNKSPRKKPLIKLSKHLESCVQRTSGLKPLYTFGTKREKKVHRFTNKLQGLQKVMVKDFSWNIIPWNALLFEKTVKQYQFSLARITDLF